MRAICLTLIVSIAAAATAAAQLEPRWKPVAKLNSPQQYHACVTADGKIYALGGYGQGACERYDPENDTWSLLPQIPTQRAFPAAAAVGRRIYVFGGLDDKQKTVAVVECFDVDRQAWQSCCELPTPRNRLAALAIHEKILVLGGMDKDGDSAAVEEFDPATGRWTSRAPMPSARHGLSAVAIDGKVLALGGYGPRPVATVEEYDPANDRWTKKADMPTPRGFFGAAAAKGYVFAIAGRVPGGRPVERFDPGSDSWKRLDPMPGEILNRFGIAVFDERIYLVGGERQQDESAPFKVWRYEPEK
ncbi:MAG: hypothetical protein HY290_05015 [Planctomycetia bacterium]|nr:hypothetical protein [Planctomycetia bacterium]